MNPKRSNHSLTAFLSNEETQIRVFDMGRRVTKIPLSEFQSFEQQKTPYPSPYQQTAWVAILFWHVKDVNQHNIWFLRMPLDEQGLINIASRDELMEMILSRIAERISTKKNEEEKLTHALKDNPYVFKPTEENMAALNAKAKLTLKLPPSQFYQPTLDYFNNGHFDAWENLGLQGFADVAAMQSDKNVNELLCKTLTNLPQTPFSALCHALENENLSIELTLALKNHIYNLIKEDNHSERLTCALRSVASINSSSLRTEIINQVLSSTYQKHPAILVIIAAKLWETLDDDTTLTLYVNALATLEDGQNIFNALISDLMFMPGKREKILACFRDPHRTEPLSIAVGNFFNQMSSH